MQFYSMDIAWFILYFVLMDIQSVSSFFFSSLEFSIFFLFILLLKIPLQCLVLHRCPHVNDSFSRVAEEEDFMGDRPTVLRTGGNLTKWRRGRDLIFAEHIFHFRLCNMPLGYVVSLIFMTTPKDKSFFFFFYALLQL